MLQRILTVLASHKSKNTIKCPWSAEAHAQAQAHTCMHTEIHAQAYTCFHTKVYTFHLISFRTVLSDMEQYSEHFVNGVCLFELHMKHDKAALTLSYPPSY
ncbi:hypothetical protein OIU76_015472 [Salix suchowensis]|nr:hypothetical protein OIU76_015472 [Salix suchowensis]